MWQVNKPGSREYNLDSTVIHNEMTQDVLSAVGKYDGRRRSRNENTSQPPYGDDSCLCLLDSRPCSRPCYCVGPVPLTGARRTSMATPLCADLALAWRPS